MRDDGGRTSPRRGWDRDLTDPDDTLTRLEQRVARERTARQEAESIAERGMRELWLANRDLEERVAARTLELEQSLHATQRADAAKEEFLEHLGHELATPLHAVLGLLELIDRSSLSAEDRARLEHAASNARQLADLLLGLVELAGTEGPSSPADTSVELPRAWLDDVVAAWTHAAAGRGQLLVPECRADAAPIAAPWTRLRQVIDLVLDNAVTHASPGVVRVSLFATTDLVRCCVSDSGPGLDDEQLATAAEPFVSFGPTGGLGVGLARASRLATGAQGRLSIESDHAATSVCVDLGGRSTPESG